MRVLEPSPPAVQEGEWLADDPVGEPLGRDFRGLVAPVELAGAMTWDDWLEHEHEHAGWVAARWLGADRTIADPPPAFAATRAALHRLAAYVVSPARRRVNGKIGLRWTLGGFGTPFFGGDEQIRVEGALIVRQVGGTARAEPIASLSTAATLVLDGPPDVGWAQGLDVPPAGDLDAALGLDPAAAAHLGELLGFGNAMLERLRFDGGSHDAGRVQLWPEHFDLAIDVSAGGGARMTAGVSPGDGAIPEPYLYVLPHDAALATDREVWNADGFLGAVRRVSDLGEPSLRWDAAWEFLLTARSALRR